MVRIFRGILFVLIGLVIPALALFFYLNRTTRIAVTGPEARLGAPASTKQTEVGILPVEIPIDQIEKDIIQGRPGFILRAKLERPVPEGSAGLPEYQYWDGNRWYDRDAEVFSRRELAEAQLKACPAPPRSYSPEVIDKAALK